MLNFKELSVNKFLEEYWQKKPLLLREALPLFKNAIAPEELAGLAMEEEIESRIVLQKPTWTLKRGPFSEEDFKQLPQSHWTLLVQGVDKFIPEVTALLDHFDFIPQWRVDDVMLSYAVNQGSVGPHYDNYDVFLYQAQGRRQWLLTTEGCVPSNYLERCELRIMKEFKVEQEFILEEGDMLYLPPHVGHHGIALSDDCMTYSFGYRSYQAQELWQSFGDYLSEKLINPLLYKDPLWNNATSELTEAAWMQARTSMQALLNNDALLKDWFACFATSLDGYAESLLASAEDLDDLSQFKKDLMSSSGLIRNSLCRFAYINSENQLSFYINGCAWDIENVDPLLIKTMANKRRVLFKELLPFIKKNSNCLFLFELWKLQWIDFLD